MTDLPAFAASFPIHHAATHDLGGADRIYPSDLGEFLDRRRSSECSTLSRLLASVSMSFTSGLAFGALSYSRTAQTYTQIRFCTGTSAPAGITDLRLGVYDATGANKLSETAEAHATVLLANTVYTLNLGTNVVAAEGDAFYPALGAIGTTFTYRGVGIVSTLTAAVGAGPAISRAASGWTTGNALPAALGSTSGNVPWIELL